MRRNFALCFMMFMAALVFLAEPVDAKTSNKENIVSGVSNPANGIIEYKLRVPAGTRVKYSVYLSPSSGGTIDKVSGSYMNRSNKTVVRTFKSRVNYLSDNYRVKASYTAGARNREVIYKDEDKIISRLKTSVISSRFTWTAGTISKWKSGKEIRRALNFSSSGTVDLFLSRNNASGVMGVVVTPGVYDKTGNVTSMKNITGTPSNGWSIRVKCVPYKGGYKQYLLVYNSKGKKEKSYKIATIPVNRITKVMK